MRGLSSPKSQVPRLDAGQNGQRGAARLRQQGSKLHARRPFVGMWADRRGQAMVEMALILPILLLIVMGIVDFGRVYNADLTLTHASREGARYAALGATDSEVESNVKSAATGLDPAKVEVRVSPAPELRRTGDPVTVAVNYSLDLVTPIISNLVGSPLALNAQTVMRIE